MAEEQFSFSPAAVAGGLESQTCQLLQNEQRKVTDAASKLDLLSRELQSMWSAQGSPTTQQATMHPLQKQGRSFSAPDAVNLLDGQSEHGGVWSGGGPVQTLTPTEPQSLPPPYTFDPLPLPGPVKPPRTHRGRLERGYAVPYSPQEQLQSKNAPPPPRNQSGYLIPYSPEEQLQSKNAPPPPRNQSGYLTPYSPEEQRQPERAPSPRLMQGYQIPYSPEEQLQSKNAPPPPRNQSGYLIPYSPQEQLQSKNAPPPPRNQSGYLIPYSPEEQLQSKNAPPPPRNQSGYLIPYSPEEQLQSKNAPPPPRNQSGYLTPYSPEEQRQPERAPSPRLMQGYQIPYSPEEQRQPDRYLIPYSPEEQRQPERAPSPRNQSGYLIPYSPEEPRHPSDRATSPRQLQPLAPSFHPAAEAENPYSEPTALRDPVPPPAGGAPNVSGVFGPVAHPPFTGSPATAPTFYIGNETWGSPQPHYPTTSAGTERGKMAFDAVDASPTPRTKPDFTTNIYSGDGTSQRKPAGVWAEADLDIAYEKKSKTPSQESKGHPRSWSLPRLGRDSWKQTDLDLANPISKPAKGRMDVDTIQLYGTLPKGSRPPWGTQPSPPRSRRPFSPWGSPGPGPSPVLAHSHFPPASPWTSAIKERRNVLPLSVLIRPTIVRGRGRGRGGGWGPWGPPPLVPGPRAPGPLAPGPPAPGPPHRQPQIPQGQQAVVPVVLVDAGETESPGGEGGGETAPRPLSPTRLQPVSVPDTGCIRDREELLRIRAAIPRALKKRSSFDHTAETAPGPVAATVKPSQPLPTILDQRVPSDQHQDTPTTPTPPQDISPTHTDTHATRSILKKEGSSRSSKKRKAWLNPLVVLLDASLLGELDVVQRLVQEIADPSESNDEGITALHNAVCGGHYDIVEFLVNHGVNVNAADSHGWTPLHCAASCNDLPICTLLVKKGAAIFCTTLNDGATAAEKCDAYLDGYEDCARFLFSAEQQAGMMNSAVLYALWDYEAEREDELSLREGQAVTVLQRGSRNEPLWWWSSLYGHEGYVAHNLLGLFPRVRPAT